ncbi:unnamed protein product, partial [marine sediment metagenome]
GGDMNQDSLYTEYKKAAYGTKYPELPNVHCFPKRKTLLC